MFTDSRLISLASSFAPAALSLAIATVTPQTFTMASPPARKAGYGVNHPQRTVVHYIPARISQI